MKKYLSTILSISLVLLLTILTVVLDLTGVDIFVSKSTLYLGILYALYTLVYVFRCYSRGYSPAIFFCSIGLSVSSTLLAGYFVEGGLAVVWPLLFNCVTFTLIASYIFVSKSRFILRASIYTIVFETLLMLGTTWSWWVTLGGVIPLLIIIILIEKNATFSDGYEIPSVSIKDYQKEE